MNPKEAGIEVTEKDGRVVSAKAILPVWTKVSEEGKIYAHLPMLGLETYADSEDDLFVAVSEAFQAFCILAEEDGIGLRSELEFIGWKASDGSIFHVKSRKPYVENMFKAAEPLMAVAEL